jgi:Cytochrome c oxidase subunit III
MGIKSDFFFSLLQEIYIFESKPSFEKIPPFYTNKYSILADFYKFCGDINGGVSIFKLKKLKEVMAAAEIIELDEHFKPNMIDVIIFEMFVGVMKFNKPISMHVNLFDKGVLINPYKLPLMNTVILLLSGAALTFSHKMLKLDFFLYAICSLIFTIVLALMFIGCQAYEYTYANFSISDGVYGSLFFMLTGFHGFHVIIGTIFLMVCLGRMILNHFTRTDHLAFECAI